MYVCTRERERERDRQTDRHRERERERERERCNITHNILCLHASFETLKFNVAGS